MAAKHASPDELIEAAPMSDLLRDLARRGVAYPHAKDRTLIEEGDRGDGLIIILEGRLRAFSRHPTNDREVTYGVYGPGEYVGEMGLDGGPRSASVETLERSLCVRIERPTLEAFIAEHPAFAFELLAKVIRRARSATIGLRQIALNNVYGRLKHLLDSLAVPQADGTRLVTERLTHLEISRRLGCGREMVSRVMMDLVRGGYVEIREDDVIVLKKALPDRW